MALSMDAYRRPSLDRRVGARAAARLPTTGSACAMRMTVDRSLTLTCANRTALALADRRRPAEARAEGMHRLRVRTVGAAHDECRLGRLLVFAEAARKDREQGSEPLARDDIAL